MAKKKIDEFEKTFNQPVPFFEFGGMGYALSRESYTAEEAGAFFRELTWTMPLVVTERHVEFVSNTWMLCPEKPRSKPVWWCEERE